MSKNKSKPQKGASKAADKTLSKVKDAGITKASQSPKAKSKDIARKLIAKEEKAERKNKKKAPTPSSSESESDSDEEMENVSASSSESESESEVETKKAAKGAAKGSKDAAKAKPVESSESESESEPDESGSDSDEESAEDKVEKKAEKASEDSEESESESESSESEDEAPAKAKKLEKAANTNGVKVRQLQFTLFEHVANEDRNLRNLLLRSPLMRNLRKILTRTSPTLDLLTRALIRTLSLKKNPRKRRRRLPRKRLRNVKLTKRRLLPPRNPRPRMPETLPTSLSAIFPGMSLKSGCARSSKAMANFLVCVS